MRKSRHQLTQWMQSSESYDEWQERERKANENARAVLIQILEGMKADRQKEKEKDNDED